MEGNGMDNISKKNLNIMKWLSGGCEAFLGIPIIGGTVILSLAWIPLFIMMAVHVLIVIVALKNKHENDFPTGNVIGLGASIFGFIPGLGMVLHIVAAVFILMEAWKTQQQLAVIKM